MHHVKNNIYSISLRQKNINSLCISTLDIYRLLIWGDIMAELAKTIGARLRNYRTTKGLTQEALAERAGLHATYIGQVERGEKNITIESLEKIISSLEISLPQLFEGIGVQSEPRTNYPLLCYELVAEHQYTKQEQLYKILQEINTFEGLDRL